MVASQHIQDILNHSTFTDNWISLVLAKGVSVAFTNGHFDGSVLIYAGATVKSLWRWRIRNMELSMTL